MVKICKNGQILFRQIFFKNGQKGGHESVQLFL